MRANRGLTLLVYLLLASASLPAAAQTRAGARAERIPDYRGIIARHLRAKKDIFAENEGLMTYFKTRGGIFDSNAKIARVEVADSIERVQTAYHGWTWEACMRLDLNGQARTYAVFILDGNIVDARSAVAIDKCDGKSYSPLRGAKLQ